MSQTHSLNLEFDCIDLPAPSAGQAQLRLGIQEKDAVKQDVALDARVATFRFAVNVVLDDAGDPEDFRGSYVHGPRSDRFVYLCWGQRKGEVWETSSRAKIELATIGRATIASAIEKNSPIKARVRMTDATGRTVAATLKPEYVEWLDVE